MKVRKVSERDYPDLAAQLKKAQEDSNLSIAKLCRQAEISTQYWYRVVKGQVDTLNFETLKKLEAALGVSFGVSFDEAEE